MEFQPNYFNQPRHCTQSHDECQRMKANGITFCRISNPADEWSNQKCYVTCETHEQSISRWESRQNHSKHKHTHQFTYFLFCNRKKIVIITFLVANIHRRRVAAAREQMFERIPLLPLRPTFH